MDIKMSGECAALLTFGEEISNELADQIAYWEHNILQENWPEIRAIVPGYCTLLIQYDPAITKWNELCKKLRSLELRSNAQVMHAELPNVVEIPVRYGGEFGPDLSFVSEYTGFSTEEVIFRHSKVRYRVHMLGFSPGLPYLGGMDPLLQTPRLESPRVRIPGGSVGIAGKQTGVYPLESPGGWRLIGRTPLLLFDPEQEDNPFLLKVGDFIEFKPVDEKAFYDLIDKKRR